MYRVLNTLSEYANFYISKNITSFTSLLVFEIVESLQCILKGYFINTGTHVDCNETRTHNHLIRKRTLNQLAKLAN